MIQRLVPHDIRPHTLCAVAALVTASAAWVTQPVSAQEVEEQPSQQEPQVQAQAKEPAAAPAANEEPEESLADATDTDVDAQVNEEPASQPPSAEELATEEAARRVLNRDVEAYRAAIAEIEATGGAFSKGLSEQMLGLGLALQRNGEHEQAVNVFKRGVHLSRVTEGLYSSRQLALLQGEIASHIALGAYQTADERQKYLFRVQAQTLSDMSRGDAYMQHAMWQRQSYEARLGEQPFARLLRMWSLYRLALTEYAKAEGQESPKLLSPLYGMLQSQYLMSGYIGETSTGFYRTRGIYGEEESQQIAYSGQSYKQGGAVIRAIYDVKVAQAGSDWRDDAEYLLMMGDWNLWHGKRTDAYELYAQLDRELALIEAAQDYRQQIFGTPTPLPDVDGVRGLPEHMGEREDRLLLEFGVTERGRVVDVQRLDTTAIDEEKVGDIVRRFRTTIFRPQITEGVAVNTQGLRWAYDSNQWFSDR